MEIIIGIDASRNRSGGAKGHLLGILRDGYPIEHGIRKVHVWSYKDLLVELPDAPWLEKHNPKELEQSLIKQLWWQRFKFPIEARKAGCSIVLNTDAGTVSRFRPSVTMSRDMLSYEPGEIDRFGFSKARLRLMLLRYMQNRSLQRSDGVIFLTKYAAQLIQRSCGKLSRIAIIPHGVKPDFNKSQLNQTRPVGNKSPIHCLYVSNFALYKHQWVVVQAIATLRKRCHNVHLTLVGGGSGSGVSRAQQLLEEAIAVCDPDRAFVMQTGFVPHKELPSLLASADLFIFASSCENMPNTLVEAMAVGLPIVCSNRGPMPDVLSDGGIYIDPEDAESIANAVEQLIKDPALRERVAQRAKTLAKQYSWSRCASETWAFIIETYRMSKSEQKPL